jgi:hypothetical protein
MHSRHTVIRLVVHVCMWPLLALSGGKTTYTQVHTCIVTVPPTKAGLTSNDENNAMQSWEVHRSWPAYTARARDWRAFVTYPTGVSDSSNVFVSLLAHIEVDGKTCSQCTQFVLMSELWADALDAIVACAAVRFICSAGQLMRGQHLRTFVHQPRTGTYKGHLLTLLLQHGILGKTCMAASKLLLAGK